MNQESANRNPAENTALCEHQWVDLGADAVYCWRRQCRLCGAVEEQAHTLVAAAYTVVGCCAHPYVCESCGYIPQ